MRPSYVPKFFATSTLKIEPMPERNRIAFAWWLEGWNFEAGDRVELEERGDRVPPSEYEEGMRNNVYCPVCYMPLFRSPSQRAVFRNKRVARYNHYHAHSAVPCRLRAPKAESVTFESAELAQQAIADGTLTIVHNFMEEAPQPLGGVHGTDGDQNQGIHEDVVGPVSQVPVSRCKGETFELPSTITTVAGLCRRFDKKLHRFYLFPGRTNVVLLASELVDVRTVTQVEKNPRLYFGKILTSFNAGKTPQNLRMTSLECHKDIKDFYLKATDATQQAKGVHDDTKGRYVIFWGTIEENGIGLCVNRPTWGEFALLPQQYERLLPLDAKLK
jgi:hypothetical protein